LQNGVLLLQQMRNLYLLQVGVQLLDVVKAAGAHQFIGVVVKGDLYVELIQLEEQQEGIVVNALANAYPLCKEPPILVRLREPAKIF